MTKKIDNRIRQTFDVRPVREDGFFDKEKFEKLQGIVNLRENEITQIATQEITPINDDTDWMDYDFSDNQLTALEKPVEEIFEEKLVLPENIFSTETLENYNFFSEPINLPQKKKNFFPKFYFLKKAIIPVGSGFLVAVFVLGVFLGIKGWSSKDFLLQSGQVAYANLSKASESVLNKNFSYSTFQFQKAYDDFDKISNEINSAGGFLADLTRYIPFLSKLSSGKYLAETGKNISRIGILSSEIIGELNKLENPLQKNGNSVSLLKIFQETNPKIKEISVLLSKTEKNIQKIEVTDLPEDKRVQFIKFKERLPELKTLGDSLLANSDVIEDVLGGKGPRKYLFLFQNNQEMRATGGFIGTYGVLDIFDGHVKKFFIDGIFNPDGQLKEKVVPPIPIQKISANWSLHDSNWFPDFPVSAEKAAWFYEKTGGPTVDGVITITPTVMKKLLSVTGPIEMSEYGVTVNQENFLETIQEEVEVNYDKNLNQPKKILADLAPIILDKIFNTKSLSDLKKIAGILKESLQEKQILIYSKNYNIEKTLSDLGWSGEILRTEKDYLSVINSNINGFKTDGVIEETIELTAQIQDDGQILNEVVITRKHNGGNTQYDWWNRVNANYMRVYVPKGSKLISAEGHTREFNSPPLDYKALNFKRDPQVEQEETGIEIDQESGTRIYEDTGKTVFANWVYVSPQETVVVKYKYLLPFRLEINTKEKNIGTYSLVAQKQSGSLGSELIANIDFPDYYKIAWKFPEDVREESGKLILKTNLVKDQYIGVAFSK